MDTNNLDLETLCIYADMAFEAKNWSHALTQNIGNRKFIIDYLLYLALESLIIFH